MTLIPLGFCLIMPTGVLEVCGLELFYLDKSDV